MKLRVSLAKEKAKLPETFLSMENDLNFTNGVEENLEDLDWGPPATPLTLGTCENGEPTVQQSQPGQGHDSASEVNAEGSVCNGEHDTIPASKKPIAAILEPFPCSKCGKEGRRRCGNCKIPYCSKECQRSHWPEHKMFCNWKNAEEKPKKKSLDASVGSTSAATPRDSLTNGHNENKPHSSLEHDSLVHNENERQQHSSKTGLPPNQDLFSFNEDDFELSGISHFANLMGIRMVPSSPENSPSPQNFTAKSIENSARSSPPPQGSHYCFLQPLKRASPKPLITEISSSVSEPQGASRISPLRDQVSLAVGAESLVRGSPDHTVVTPRNVGTSKEPQNRPYKRYYFNEVPQQNISIGGSYEIVSTSVSSPTLFWAQLYEESALASQNYLYETIKAEYENTAYKTYVPSPNEMCIAQFSLDNNWYRSRVDYIGNSGLIRVTHIDFGSSEDVDPSKIRRIKEDLVRVPRQGIKCALHLPECPTMPREWSSEAIDYFRSKVLDVKCRAEVKKVKDSVIYVDVFDSKDNSKINDIFKEKQQERPTLAKPVPIYPQSSQQTNRENAERFQIPERSSPHLSTSSRDNTQASPLGTAEDTLSSRGASPSPSFVGGGANPSPSFTGQASTVGGSNPSPSFVGQTSTVEGANPSPSFMSEASTVGGANPSPSFMSQANTTGGANPSPSFMGQTSTVGPHVPEITRKENADPVMPDNSTNAARNRYSPMLSSDSAFSPAITNASGAARRAEAASQVTQSSYNETNSSPDNYYTRPSHPSNGNPGGAIGDTNPTVPISGQESPNPSSARSVSSQSSSKSGSEVDIQIKTPESLMPENTGVVHGLPFKGVVTSVKSPWDFAVKLSDSQMSAQFESVANDLNVYCSTAPFEVQKVYSHNELCAVRLNEERTWHRAKVVANFLQEGYKVILIDLGSEKVVSPQGMRTMPDHFKSVEPRCRRCSLGGVRKPAGSLVWGKKTIDRFTVLVLYRNFTFKEINKHKHRDIVDMLDEDGQPSVAMELINAGLAEAFIKKVERFPDGKEASRSVLLPFKNAITSAKLPPPKTPFQIMATDIQSPALFSVQLADKETNQSFSELCAEMNKYYADSTPNPNWQPRESEVCAVFFKGSWIRAYIKSIEQDSAAKVYCVDFGNTDVVTTSVIRPLASTFQAVPHCALRCCLGNIVPMEGDEWPKEVTEFMKLKLPMSSTLNAHIFYRGQTILFLDVFVASTNGTESLVKLLVSKGMAKYKGRKEERSTGMAPGITRDRSEGKFVPYKPGIPPSSLSVQGCAIAAANLPNERETFRGIITEAKEAGEMYIQVANEALTTQLAELLNSMNTFYSKAVPTKFEAKQNLLCAAKFSMDWRRAYILAINSDETATVYDVDFGKTETLPISHLQFLQPQFTRLQYFALKCRISIPRSVRWTKQSYELLLSKVKFLVPVNIKLCTKRKDIIFIDILIPESSQTLVDMIIDQNQERRNAPQVSNQEPKPRHPNQDTQTSKMRETGQPIDVKRSNFARALSSVKLPPEGETFNAVITEFQSPQCFYIHSDLEMATKLTNLSAEMNNYYNTLSRSSFQPMENQLCVAPFGSPNDWYRALVEQINANQTATVFFVDYGNTDDVPVANLHQLEDRFSELPYCALNTSLANVNPTDTSGWTSSANEFVKSKLPIGVGVSLKLISKRQDILFVDVVDPTSEEGSLCGDLVKNGLASSSSRNKPKSPSSPIRSSSGPSQQSWPSPRKSAIGVASLPPYKETFQVIVTHITSPGSFAVHVADYEMACKVAALGKEMTDHYQSTQYPPFSPAPRQLCAARFTGNDEWYRGWIENIFSNDRVEIYYIDYGNSEVLGVSRLRPLEKHFTALPFSALTCSIAHVVPEEQGEWKQEATDLFTSSVPLYQPIDVKLVYKKRDCLYLDMKDPNDSSGTLSKTFVERGLAVWMLPSKKLTREATDDSQARSNFEESKEPSSIVSNYRPNNSQVSLPLSSPPGPSRLSNADQEIPVQNPVPPSKHFLQSVPMVGVPTNDCFNAMVCDIKKTGAVSFQVLTPELKDLDALCLKIGNHCSQVDHSPYCPVEGELCLASFSLDKNWYRAVVTGVLPNNLFRVSFVDFGNDDTVSPSDIRKIEAEFLHLPRQAYTGHLVGLPMGESLKDDVLRSLSGKLLDKRVFACVSGSTSEIEFFDVGADEKPAASINKELLQSNTVNITQNQPSSLTPSVENEFTALVSEVIGTSEIWLQRKDAIESLNLLKTDLDSYCESRSSVPLTVLPRRDDICLCKFSIDRSWYRAKVIESNSPDNILVLFLDYGNTEVVTLNSLREPKSQFMQFPFQGIKCYLFGVAQEHPDADDYVQQILNRELVVKVRERRTEKLGVELEDHGVPNGPFNINEILIGFGHSA